MDALLNIEFYEEPVEVIEKGEEVRVIELPSLTEEEKRIVDPLIAPTSGLRMQIYEVEKGKEKDKYILPRRKLFLFLRVLKAISEEFIESYKTCNLKVLIVTDDRPSQEILLKYGSQIFVHDGYQVYYQKDEDGHSRLSAPYGAASVALLEDIRLVIVLTASHNDLSWNGIKFYMKYPIPISGNLFKKVTKRALGIKTIPLKSCNPIQLDAEARNNEYIRELLSQIIEIKSIKNQNLVIWPYLGEARGIVALFKSYGANVILIEEKLNPPNPIKIIKEEKLKEVMLNSNAKMAILLDADRDRIALYVHQNGEFIYYIPNEIYSAMHNVLAEKYGKNIINVRTIPSDPRGDYSSFLNVLTGVGYKHLGLILYFLFDIVVEQSKIDTAILYLEDSNKNLIKINNPLPLKDEIIKLMKSKGLTKEKFIIVMWEESGGHTINTLTVSKNLETGEYSFTSDFPLIADKYPAPALVLITELIYRGYYISESIDWTVKGINRTIAANDEEKIKIMENFKKNDGNLITIGNKQYQVQSLSDNSDNVDIYQLKSNNSILYFRPSGTGPEVRFYIFGDKETYLEEIKTVQRHVKENYS
ncbi:MAG: hypothetical protein ACTSYC_09470 [Promethearchaeota archaeon]